MHQRARARQRPMSEEAGQQGASINAQGRVYERGKRLSDDVILWVVTLFKKTGQSPSEISQPGRALNLGSHEKGSRAPQSPPPPTPLFVCVCITFSFVYRKIKKVYTHKKSGFLCMTFFTLGSSQ